MSPPPLNRMDWRGTEKKFLSEYPEKVSLVSHAPEANLKHTGELITGKEDSVNHS